MEGNVSNLVCVCPNNWTLDMSTSYINDSLVNISSIDRQQVEMAGINYSFVFSFENNFDGTKTRGYMAENWHFSLYVGAIYLILITMGQHFMKNRPPMNLRTGLACWNVILAIFSLMGSYRTLPELIHVLKYEGFRYSLCDNSYAENKVSGYWGFLFTMSKMAELIDTGFIVARKQPLKFIHWFHHVVTMFVTWSNFAEAPAIARWLMTVNYIVHTFMYSYYAFKVARFRVPEWVALIITTSQIAQMLGALLGTIYIAGEVIRGSQCDASPRALLVLCSGYALFLLLFVKFFIQRYFRNRNKLTSSKKIN